LTERSSPGTTHPGVLDLYEDPDLYDATYLRRRSDVRFYVERALQVGGPVLEYGVGSGRVALALARAGLELTGVDASAAMVQRLRAKRERLPRAVAARLQVVQGDMRRVQLDARFALVTAPFNVVLHLDSRRDMERWLSRVRQHLLPGGVLLFDVSVPQPQDLAADPSEWHRARPFRHPVTGRRTEQAERFQYDPLQQVLLVESELRPEGSSRPLRVPLVHRQWFPRELEALLHYNGYGEIRFSADFTERPPDDAVDSLVITCRVLGSEPPRSVGQRSASRARP
jgi:SAM-dependent methyltransferase